MTTENTPERSPNAEQDNARKFDDMVIENRIQNLIYATLNHDFTRYKSEAERLAQIFKSLSI
jgi:hypothetical protein